ncbi:hypothetical protein B5F76_09835 [Desulfovibrio sp. An276]|nr:hypothetical protein B5F76_09835 [Desulfovibrio sp. An276]
MNENPAQKSRIFGDLRAKSCQESGISDYFPRIGKNGTRHCRGKFAFLGKNMKGMGQRAKGYGRGLAQSYPLAELSPEGPGKDGFLQEFDLRKDCFGCVPDLLFLRKKIIEDADDLLLLGKRGNTHANA